MLGWFVAEVPFITRIEISFPNCTHSFHLFALPVHLHAAKYQKDVRLGEHRRAAERSSVARNEFSSR